MVSAQIPPNSELVRRITKRNGLAFESNYLFITNRKPMKLAQTFLPTTAILLLGGMGLASCVMRRRRKA
jgi:hypothetical protein